MTDDEVIHHLIHDAPKRVVSKWDHLWRVLAAVAAVFSFIAFGGVVSLWIGKANTADCLNTALGDRNSASAQQGAAITEFVASFDALTALPKDMTQGQRAAATATLESHIEHAYSVLKQVNAYRTAHPLGKC